MSGRVVRMSAAHRVSCTRTIGYGLEELDLKSAFLDSAPYQSLLIGTAACAEDDAIQAIGRERLETAAA